MGIFDKVTDLFKSKKDKEKKGESKLDLIAKKNKSILDDESESVPETKSESDSIDESESAPETKSESDSIDESESAPETKSESDSIDESESVPEIKSESDSIDESESATEIKSDAKIELDAKSQSLDKGLKKTKESFFGKLARTVAGRSKIDELALDEIEEVLISSDIGVDTTIRIISKLEERVEKEKYINTSELNSFLKEEISLLMQDSYDDIPKINEPYVIMIVGVNGVGKTTTIGKLAYQFKKEGKKVVLGAADTFRAAAVDQLVIWANRVGVDIVKQDMGSDPASVAFDTVQSAKASGADVVIIDTAGRLHNNVNLMRELTKIRSVMGKVIINAPHDVMLVLDASTGQNAIEQAKQFTSATDVDSIALTKLDGTAKGGVVIGISDQFQIPVRYIGVGEGLNDLQKFNKEEFVDSLFR